MKTLQSEREQLENRLSNMEDSHTKRFSMFNVNETAYLISCSKMKEVYDDLSSVCDKLGTPIPIIF